MKFIIILFLIITFIKNINCQLDAAFANFFKDLKDLKDNYNLGKDKTISDAVCERKIDDILMKNKTIDNMSCDELKNFKQSINICSGILWKDLIEQTQMIIDNKCKEPIIAKECYGCLRIGSGNEYVSGAQNGCDGTGYECNIAGNNCNTCWTNNPNSMEKWCKGNNFHDKDNNKDISYKVQRVGEFNCETKTCWPGSHCGW